MARLSLNAEMMELIDALRAGELSPAAAERLEKLLLTSDEAVRIYVEQTHLQATLRLLVGRALSATGRETDKLTDGVACASSEYIGLPVTGLTASGVLGLVGSAEASNAHVPMLATGQVKQDFLKRVNTLFSLPSRKLLLAALILVIGTIGALGAWNFGRGKQVPLPIPIGSGGVISPFLATLSATESCVWQGGVLPTYEGARLTAGTLRLERGIAEITFDGGVRILLEGPAEFEVVSTHCGYLYDGRLVARMSPDSAGFLVRTPTVQIVDLGTEFGVDVGPSGASEVFCFEGLIELQSVDADREGRISQIDNRRLSAGELAKINSAGEAAFDRLDSSPIAFVRKLPKHTLAAQYGQSVNVDFGTHESPRFRGRGVFVGAEDAGEKPYWNAVEPKKAKSSPLLASNGEITSVVVTLAGGLPWYTAYSRSDHALLDDYAVAMNSTGRFVISGLIPGQRYDLYLYGTCGVSNAEQHRIGYGAAEGTLFTIENLTKATLGLRRGDRPFSPGKDYVVFEGVAASSQGEIRGTWSPNPQANSPANNNPFGIFNGFQIVGPLLQGTAIERSKGESSISSGD